MMTTLATRARRQEGFTLIELLITILIIGILAAIGLAAYNGQRDRARDAKTQTAVRNALTAAKSFYTQKETYTGFNAAALTAEEASLQTVAAPATTAADANKIAVLNVTATHVDLCAGSESGKVFCIKEDMGTTPTTLRVSDKTGANDAAKTTAAIAKTASDW